MLYNLKRCYTATIGTGTLTIGAAILNDFSDIPDGTTVSYSIIQGSLSAGFDAEVGRGTYSAGTLARDIVLSSTSGGAKIALDGTAQVVVTALAEDFVSFSGGVAGQVAAWSSTDTITAGALIPPASNILTLTNAAASTLALNITAGKTLTLTAADNYALTVPATMIAAGRNVANTFTAAQILNDGSTYPSPMLTVYGTIRGKASSANDVIIEDGAGNRVFRGVLSTSAWSDSTNSQFFQVGGGAPSAPAATFTVGGGTAFTRLLFRSTLTMFSVNNLNPTPATFLHLLDATTTTNAVRDVLRIEATVSTASTGGANGFGTGISLSAETATNATSQLQALIASSWIDATNATRKAKLILSAYDTAIRTGLEIEASGTAAKIGFFGGTTAVQQVLAAYTSDGEGAAYTGIDNAQAGTVYATVVDLNQLRVAYETLRASYDDLRTKLLTSTLIA